MNVLGTGFWALGSLGASLLNILDKKTKLPWLFSRGGWGSNPRYSGGPRSRLSQWTLVVNAAAASYTLFSCYASKSWALHSPTFGCWSQGIYNGGAEWFTKARSMSWPWRNTGYCRKLGQSTFPALSFFCPNETAWAQRRPKLSSVNKKNEWSALPSFDEDDLKLESNLSLLLLCWCCCLGWAFKTLWQRPRGQHGCSGRGVKKTTGSL